MKRHRQSRGKMLILVALVTVLITFVFLVGILFMTLLSQHSRSQYNVDALALNMAKILNSGDRVGQMNQMVARNRELVYTTRQDAIACEEQGLGHLAPLCEQLLDEAYSAHDEIEGDRMHQIDLVSKELLKASRDYNNNRNGNSISIFPWLKTFEPEVTRVDVGGIKNVQSNVRETTVIDELAQFDHKQNYVEPGSNLFRANINAKLPAPDERLDFKFSALPAFVENTCAPPRVANLEMFDQYPIVIRDKNTGSRPNDRMPYAVRLFTSMDVALDAEQLDRHAVNVDSIGVAGGAISDYE
jgi:hypothetical protein